MGQQTTWGLAPEFISDITSTFNDPASIYRWLETHSNYWGPKIVAQKGVKRTTATKIARTYLRVLKSVYDNKYTGNGIDLETARRMYVKYEQAVLTENLADIVIGVR